MDYSLVYLASLSHAEAFGSVIFVTQLQYTEIHIILLEVENNRLRSSHSYAKAIFRKYVFFFTNVTPSRSTKTDTTGQKKWSKELEGRFLGIFPPETVVLS